MAHLSDLPSLRKQHLLSEFTGLKQACPEGIFVTVTPGDPTLWSAVLFVRDGPYASAVLRFQISFPDTYPKLPPLVLFLTDIFHPLVSPLTTYMYSTDIQDNGTVSAADQERLPPGGFSLHHGYPEWFGRGTRQEPEAKPTSSERLASPGPDRTSAASESSVTSPLASDADTPSSSKTEHPSISIYSILKYIRSTFDTLEVLDSVPLNAAGNPGAWHAWRTHRRKQAQLSDQEPSPNRNMSADGSHIDMLSMDGDMVSSSNPTVRRPGEWNWDGVWEDRVKKGISASLSESVLYGGSGVPDEMIRFLPMEEPDIVSVKENLRRTLGGTD